MAHYGYDLIVRAAREKTPEGYAFAVVTLGKGDTSDDPSSTKRVVHGPSVGVWQIHPTGVQVYLYETAADVPEEVRRQAVEVGAGTYVVEVHDRTRKGRPVVARTLVAVGDWQAIGYWLDDGGLIGVEYETRVTVMEGWRPAADPAATARLAARHLAEAETPIERAARRELEEFPQGRPAA